MSRLSQELQFDLSPTEKRKLVCKMYLDGATFSEIMRATGYMTRSSISKIVSSNGISNRLPTFSQSQIDQMFSLWQDRLSLNQIAIKMDLTKDQVRYQLKKMCLVD